MSELLRPDKQLCYLAGPMRGYVEYNFPAFHAAAAKLRAQGLRVWSPAENDQNEGFDPAKDTAGPLRHYMKADLPAVLNADMVCVLPGWEKSQGACLEVHVAQTCGIPVYMADTMQPVTPSAIAPSNKAWSEMSPLERAAYNAGVASVSHEPAKSDPVVERCCMKFETCTETCDPRKDWLRKAERPNEGLTYRQQKELERATEDGKAAAHEAFGNFGKMLLEAAPAPSVAPKCGCVETYPQLVPGKVSHGPGCALAAHGIEEVLRWCVTNDGECLGDHPAMLQHAKDALAPSTEPATDADEANARWRHECATPAPAMPRKGQFTAMAWGDRIADEQLDELVERTKDSKTVLLRIDQFRDLARQAKSSAAPSSTAATEQEPCVWRWKLKRSIPQAWQYSEKAPTADDVENIEPLYPLPWAPSAIAPNITLPDAFDNIKGISRDLLFREVHVRFTKDEHAAAFYAWIKNFFDQQYERVLRATDGGTHD